MSHLLGTEAVECRFTTSDGRVVMYSDCGSRRGFPVLYFHPLLVCFPFEPLTAPDISRYLSIAPFAPVIFTCPPFFGSWMRLLLLDDVHHLSPGHVQPEAFCSLLLPPAILAVLNPFLV
jgi:hypothetical protein